jgi:murein DD-endopeptidase MepM/ murein hydrolase activator NlpD
VKYCVLFLLIFFGSFPLQAQIEDEEEEDLELSSDSLIESTTETEEIQFGEDYFFEGFLSEIGYYFDSTLIPSHEMYGIWDTKIIHPYQSRIDSIADGKLLRLVEGDDCFFHPPTFSQITSDFGLRRLGRKLKFHYGIDLKLQTGDPVYAMFDGIVRIAKYSSSYGYVVVLRHYNGLETIYAHFSKLLVVPGMAIRAGEPIGLGGNTGRSTGAHLHFEVRYKGVAFNPALIIDWENNTLKSDTFIVEASVFSHMVQVRKVNAAKYHKVKSGETLGSIAKKYRTTVGVLKALNKMSSSKIRKGQVIRVR